MKKQTSSRHTLYLQLVAFLMLASVFGLAVGAPLATAGEPAQYYVEDGGQPAGPFGLEQLRQRQAAGTFNADTLAWTEGMADWQPARQIPALADLFRSSPPPMPGRSAQPDHGGSQVSAPPAPTPLLQRDISEFLAGQWRTSGQLPVEGYGPSDAEMNITYHSSGSFDLVGQYRVSDPGAGIVPIDVRAQGQWDAPVSERNERDELRSALININGNLTMTVSPEFGVPPQTEPLNDSDQIQIIDEDSIRDGQGLVWKRGTRW